MLPVSQKWDIGESCNLVLFHTSIGTFFDQKEVEIGAKKKFTFSGFFDFGWILMWCISQKPSEFPAISLFYIFRVGKWFLKRVGTSKSELPKFVVFEIEISKWKFLNEDSSALSRNFWSLSSVLTFPWIGTTLRKKWLVWFVKQLIWRLRAKSSKNRPKNLIGHNFFLRAHKGHVIQANLHHFWCRFTWTFQLNLWKKFCRTGLALFWSYYC